MLTSEQTLARIRVASPCSASWADMAGDERVRHCALCKHNVYDLLAMTATEAAGLVRAWEGRLCVRFYRRADGTVLTADCPAGVRAQRRRAATHAAGAVALGATLAGALLGRDGRHGGEPTAKRDHPVEEVRYEDLPPPPLDGEMVLDMMDFDLPPDPPDPLPDPSPGPPSDSIAVALWGSP